MNFIDFVVDAVKEYAEKFDLGEKEVFVLFSRDGVFEYLTDEFARLQESSNIVEEIVRYREIKKRD